MADRFQFQHHVIDTDLDDIYYGQTALADLDNCGRPEFVMGRRTGDIWYYKYQSPDSWTKHHLGSDSPSDVGACAIDVDGDGWIDIVTGGAWYRNPGKTDATFERIPFDADLASVHDVVVGDVDGDGRTDVLTMSDRNTLRWYRIPDDPRQPWEHQDIGAPVHAGLSVGDVDNDGSLDVVRTDVWFENVNGDGTEWVEHPIGPNTPPPEDFQPAFAFDATYSVVCDMNRNGINDIVFVDAEIPGGKIWWMENLDGKGGAWKRHDVFVPGEGPRRGAYHTLHVGDMDGDGDLDIFSCEMEAVGGDAPPRYYIWENLDGKGGAWEEHVILDVNLGGHCAVVGDVTGNGLPDIVSKPWNPSEKNAVGGSAFVVFLENVSNTPG